jgi:hypothetical protein
VDWRKALQVGAVLSNTLKGFGAIGLKDLDEVFPWWVAPSDGEHRTLVAMKGTSLLGTSLLPEPPHAAEYFSEVSRNRLDFPCRKLILQIV